jgi:hypothetical protein
MSEFAAWCSDFYVNQRLSLKMDLPDRREPVLELFDRIRRECPRLSRMRRFEHEVALESAEDSREFLWVSLRRTSLRSGHVNPSSTADAYHLHRMLLETAPWYLSMSPLDIDHVELVFGFDIETEANRDEVVYGALMGESPLAALVDSAHDRPLDIQPCIGLALNATGDLQAFFEVKTRPQAADASPRTSAAEPISVFCTVRKSGPLKALEELPVVFATLCGHAERLCEQRVIPHLVMPIRQAISM